MENKGERKEREFLLQKGDNEFSHQDNTSVITVEQIDNLEKIRNLPFCQRIFRGLKKGSLRGIVLMWIRMTLGIGILTLPNYVKVYGLITGSSFIILSACINYMAYSFIFQSTYRTGKTTYPDLIKTLLGNKFHKIFQVTFMLDVCSTVMIYCIISWNLFEYMIYFFKIGESHYKEWIENFDTIQFRENNETIMTMRYIFFLSIFLITIPLFLKKTLDSLQSVTVMFLAVLFILVFYILGELPFFYSAYETLKINTNVVYFKKPNYNWLENIFGLLIAYYVQPFIFSLRGELLLPSLRRTKKIARISVLLECILFFCLGFFGYFVLGDRFTPGLFILRRPYPGKNYYSEKVFQIIIGLFFILNTLGLAMYNSSVRDYLARFIDIERSNKKYIMVSLLPFFLICLCAALYPSIMGTLNLFGYTVYNFNGYIIPILLKIQLIKMDKDKKWKLILAYCWLIFFVGVGITCVVFKILGKS